MQTVTIRDVAKRADVGVGTVSRVINESPNVAKATRARVMAAISELDYSPNSIARQLSSGKSMTIGAIVPTFTRPSFVERLRGVVQTLDNSDYDLIVYSVESLEQRNQYVKEAAIRDRVDAVVLISVQIMEEEAQAFIRNSTPTILVDAYHPQLNSIYIDDVKGGRKAIDHLTELGHRKIAFLSDQLSYDLGNSAMPDRYRGYLEGLAAVGVTPEKRYHVEVLHDRNAARTGALSLLMKPNRPTAIVAATDTHAFGALQAATDLGLRVPEDLSVIGYDDVELAEYMRLTTISQSLEESGVRGAGLTLDALNSAETPTRQIEIETSLVQRATTAPPPN